MDVGAFLAGIASATLAALHTDAVTEAAIWLLPYHCAVAVIAYDATVHLGHGMPRDARARAELPVIGARMFDAARQWAGHACLAPALIVAGLRLGDPPPGPTCALAAAFGATACWGVVEGAVAAWHAARVTRVSELPDGEGGDDVA